MADHHVEKEIIEEKDGSEGWLTRLILSVGGILLLAGAIAAWQMQGSVGGHYAWLMPWLILGAVVLGGAAVLESITAEIWVTIIGGVFVLLTAYVLAGRVNVQIDAAAHQAYVVDRFTGQVRVCDKTMCHELEGFGTVSGVSKEATEQAKEHAANAVTKVQEAGEKLAPKDKTGGK